MAYDLSIEEVRVLGALIEKHNTTPDYYPLTLNSLLSACNQKSNREPVLTLDDRSALRAIDNLRERHFAWMVQSADARVPKYEHNFDKHLGLTLQEVAVLCVLFLRGAQTLGEVRSRCARIYPFEDMQEVTITLDALLEHEDPMVVKLPLQPGRKEARYTHLMSGEPDLSMETFVPTGMVAASATPAVDPELLETLELEVTDLREEVSGLTATVSEIKGELSSLQQAFRSFKEQFE